MTKLEPLRLLLADDEKPIVNIYRMGLQRYFSNSTDTAKSELEQELFGEAHECDRPVSITVCRQGGEAVALATEAYRSGSAFDVVILDIRMPPGIDGVEAAVQIRELDPLVPIIFVSGYSDYSELQLRKRVPPQELVSVIEKPTQLAHLADQIQKVTNDRSAS